MVVIISKIKKYQHLMFLNVIGIVVICIIDYLNIKLLSNHNYLQSIFSLLIGSFGTSIIGGIDVNKFNRINRDYKKLHGKTVVTFNQIDEDICQLNDEIGGVYYESGVLCEDLQRLNQRCIDFSSHKIRSLLDATVDGMWSLKMSSRKVSSVIDSRFSDIWLNVNNDILLKKFYKTKCEKIKEDMAPIREDILYLPDKYFDEIPTKKVLKKIIINDRFCLEREKLINTLKNIHDDTTKDLDMLSSYRKMISNW